MVALKLYEDPRTGPDHRNQPRPGEPRSWQEVADNNPFSCNFFLHEVWQQRDGSIWFDDITILGNREVLHNDIIEDPLSSQPVDCILPIKANGTTPLRRYALEQTKPLAPDVHSRNLLITTKRPQSSYHSSSRKPKHSQPRPPCTKRNR